MANASLSKIFDYFDIKVEPEVNTVNGWVCMCLDKLPAKGDTFEYVTGDKLFKGRVSNAYDKKALEINLVVEKVPDMGEKGQEQ